MRKGTLVLCSTWFFKHAFYERTAEGLERLHRCASSPERQNFDDNRKAFSLCPYVASFKMISSKSDFIHNLRILYMSIAPGQGQKTLGSNF